MRPRIPSPWGRALVARVIYLVLSFLAGFLVLAGFGLLDDLTQAAGDPDGGVRAGAQLLEDPQVLTMLLGVQALVGVAVALGMTVWIDRRPILGGVNVPWGSRSAELGWGLMLGVVLASVVVLSISAAGKRHVKFHGFADAGVEWGILAGLVVLASAIMEELLVRGYLYGTLRPAYAPGGTIPCTSIRGAALHRTNPGSSPIASINVFIVGIVLGQLREITNGIAVPIGLHAGWNLAAGIVLGTSVSGLTLPSVFRISTHDLPVALGGGDFGPEGSLLVTVLFGGLAAWLAYRMVRVNEHEGG